MIDRNFREASEMIGLRLTKIKPNAVAELWHVALLNLFKYAALRAI